MKHKYYVKVILTLLVVMYLIGCDTYEPDYYWTKTVPYIFEGTYNLIKVPVPDGGIEFPIGIDDDETARVEKAFYIGETLVSRALWDTVARWASEEKVFARYRDVFYYHHHKDDDGLKRNDNKLGMYGNLPIGQDDSFLYGNGRLGYNKNNNGLNTIPQWCNAYTEWYNEKHGTNFVPVYQDIYGNPINISAGSDYNLLDYINPDANGFRLPTAMEWELAARWNGNISINTVTKTINGIDFSNQSIKFTTGRSASGGRKMVDDYNENNRVAVWKNNSKNIDESILEPSWIKDGYLAPVKSKEPNYLGIYDMSGNAMEHTNTYTPRTGNWLGGYRGGYQSKGGSFTSDFEDIAIGKLYEHGSVNSNFSFRLARNAE